MDTQLLDQLNHLSLIRTFTPQVDIDWNANTSDEEFAILFETSSLFAGTNYERFFDRPGRTRFAQYQQMNLMLFTGLLERYGIALLSRMYELDDSQPFTEYLGNFLKEEIYHYTMFSRAVQQIQSAMGDLPPLPAQPMERTLRGMFRFAGLLPGKKLRANVAFLFFQFAESATMVIHQIVSSAVPRRDSLIRQVWAFHAQDEARHLAFDRLILEHCRLHWTAAALARTAATAYCLLLALQLNANEIWAARQLGVPVRLWHLPQLVRETRAPFKHRVFRLLWMVLNRKEPASQVSL